MSWAGALSEEKYFCDWAQTLIIDCQPLLKASVFALQASDFAL